MRGRQKLIILQKHFLPVLHCCYNNFLILFKAVTTAPLVFHSCCEWEMTAPARFPIGLSSIIYAHPYTTCSGLKRNLERKALSSCINAAICLYRGKHSINCIFFLCSPFCNLKWLGLGLLWENGRGEVLGLL